MNSKKRYEGYLLIDHRGMGEGIKESATYTCSHCQYIVIINTLRTRERVYCSKCDHYICDACGAVASLTGVCKTFKQVADEVQEQGVLNG